MAKRAAASTRGAKPASSRQPQSRNGGGGAGSSGVRPGSGRGGAQKKKGGMDPVLLGTLITFGIALVVFLVVFLNSGGDGGGNGGNGGGGTSKTKLTAHQDEFDAIVKAANIWAAEAEAFMDDYMELPADDRETLKDKWKKLLDDFRPLQDRRNDWDDAIDALAAQKNADGSPVMSEKTATAYHENMSQKFHRATEALAKLRKETAFQITK